MIIIMMTYIVPGLVIYMYISYIKVIYTLNIIIIIYKYIITIKIINVCINTHLT